MKDGNHRVSVAREHGVEFIDAEVIEGHVRVPLTPTMSTAELLLQAEYAEFLRRTDLDRLQPDHDIRPTALGRYDEIWEDIVLHQAWLIVDPGIAGDSARGGRRLVHLQLPANRARSCGTVGVLDEFPNLTEADIYLWVMRHRDALGERDGQDVGPVESAEDYAEVMTQPLGVGDRMLEFLGAESLRSPDAEAGSGAPAAAAIPALATAPPGLGG